MKASAVPPLFSPKLVTEKVVFLDGLSRAGKFLLGKLVSHFQGIEYFQYVPLLEHLPILSTRETMRESDAIAYFRMTLNMAVYDRAIGRGLNRRKKESSSLLNSHEVAAYFAREDLPDGSETFGRWRDEGRRSSFLTHECAPFWHFFAKAIPSFEMIHIQRHPIDLAHSWWKRGWGERWGTDPLAFIPVFGQEKEVPVPWFASEFSEDFRRAAPLDRVLMCMGELYRRENAALDEMKREGARLLSLDYETFFNDPWRNVKRMGEFLGSEPFPRTEVILEREGCFTPLSLSDRTRKFAELRETGVPRLIEDLSSVSSLYEKRWGEKP